MKKFISGHCYIQIETNTFFNKKNFNIHKNLVSITGGILTKVEITGFLWWKRMKLIYLIPEAFYKK